MNFNVFSQDPSLQSAPNQPTKSKILNIMKVGVMTMFNIWSNLDAIFVL